MSKFRKHVRRHRIFYAVICGTAALILLLSIIAHGAITPTATPSPVVTASETPVNVTVSNFDDRKATQIIVPFSFWLGLMTLISTSLIALGIILRYGVHVSNVVTFISGLRKWNERADNRLKRIEAKLGIFDDDE